MARPLRPAIRAGLGAAMLGGLAAACGPSPSTPSTVTPDAPVVAPGDFVLLPCEAPSDRPCAYVMAGGKRLMFGAPAGAGAAFTQEEFAGLEMLMLFSLHPEDVAGVDEVRYAGWRGGRESQLPVTGPDGSGAFINALNNAYEQSDSISFVADGAPAGGFVAALLEPGVDVAEEALVYDSGDIKVRAAAGRLPGLTYRIGYRDIDETWHEALLVPCNGEAMPPEGNYTVAPEDRTVFGCGDDTDADEAWPLQAPVFIVKTEG